MACAPQATPPGESTMPNTIPPEMCYLGWRDSLNLLALLVEPDIPA